MTDREKASRAKHVNFPKNPPKVRKFTMGMCSFNSEGTAVFHFSHDDESFMRRMSQIEGLFKSDGMFNPNSPIAEEYAICLDNGRKHQAAMELFEDIIGDSSDILEVRDDSDLKDWICKPVVNKRGKLGYAGAIYYARLCLRETHKEKEAVGLQILKEIAVKIPRKCVPFGLQCALVEALKILINREIEITGIDLVEKLGYVTEQQQAVQ